MSEQNQHRYREKHLTQHKTADNLTVSQCSFCGAHLDEDDRFCPDCGNPREGIRCPKCGTLSRRSFCSHCNTPLNEAAHEAVRQAKTDPMFQRAEQLATELAALEKQLEAGGIQAATLDTSINTEARLAANRYAALFGDVASLKVPDKPATTSKPREKTLTGNPLQAAIEAYKAKAEELQRTISAMLPPPQATPEEQRNFFCARKIMTVEMRAVRQEWVCNFCGCHHNQPSECAEPQLGGTWIFKQQATQVAKTIYG